MSWGWTSISECRVPPPPTSHRYLLSSRHQQINRKIQFRRSQSLLSQPPDTRGSLTPYPYLGHHFTSDVVGSTYGGFTSSLTLTTKMSGYSIFTRWPTAALPRHASTDTQLLDFSVEHSALNTRQRTRFPSLDLSPYIYVWCTMPFSCYCVYSVVF